MRKKTAISSIYLYEALNSVALQLTALDNSGYEILFLVEKQPKLID